MMKRRLKNSSKRPPWNLLKILTDKLEALENYSQSDLEDVFKAVMDETGLKLGKIAQPVRVALTGRTASPGIFEIIAILGKEGWSHALRKAIQFIEARVYRWIVGGWRFVAEHISQRGAESSEYIFPFGKIDVWNLRWTWQIMSLNCLMTSHPSTLSISWTNGASSNLASTNISQKVKGRQYNKEFIQYLALFWDH